MQADLGSNADNQPDAAQPDLPSGLILRAAREQQQLSIDDVAHALHLSHNLILALEASDFAALGPPVFVRGYLRNYARLLDLPQHQVLAGFPSADLEPEEFRTMSLKTELKPGVNLYGWLLWSSLVLILLIAAIILLINLQGSTDQRTAVSKSVVAEAVVTNEAAAPAVKSPADPNATAINAAELQSAVDNTTDTTDATVAPEASLPVVTEETTTVATSAEGAVSLMLTFSEECWVEIADSKRSLLYGLKKAGAVVMLEGIPPFKLFLGNRQAVQIELAGRPYAIPAGPPDAGNTARFTIEEVPLQ